MENQVTKIETMTDKQLIGYLDAMGLAQKLTDKEKIQFLEISKAFGLNPFKREIYCSKYGEGQYAQMSIIVGYETYIKRAERSGQLDGWQVITEGSISDSTLKAVITIHRKDRKVPFVHEVFYSEYVQYAKGGEVTKFWQKSYTMIKKVAMAQGFRLCFSDELGGMPYTKEEVNDTEDSDFVEIKTSGTLPEIFKTAAEIEAEVYNLLLTSQTPDELKTNWDAINKELKAIPRIKELKDRLKEELSKQLPN